MTSISKARVKATGHFKVWPWKGWWLELVAPNFNSPSHSYENFPEKNIHVYFSICSIFMWIFSSWIEYFFKYFKIPLQTSEMKKNVPSTTTWICQMKADQVISKKVFITKYIRIFCVYLFRQNLIVSIQLSLSFWSKLIFFGCKTECFI